MKIALVKADGGFFPYSEADQDRFNKLSNAIYETDIKNMDMRTLKQNNALHLWCEKIAFLLNGHGLYMTGIFENEIEWDMELVKTQIVKKTIRKRYGIDSTTKLKRKEIDDLIDYITLAFGLKGVKIPDFPSKDLWREENERIKNDRQQ